MPKRKPPTSKPTPGRNRPAVNFTLDPKLKKVGDDMAKRFGLYTAQGGEQRPRISALFGGFLLMMSDGKISLDELYEAACAASCLEPDETIKQEIASAACV